MTVRPNKNHRISDPWGTQGEAPDQAPAMVLCEMASEDGGRVNPKRIAAFLSSTSASLPELGIREETEQWHSLFQSLWRAEAEDALVIFEAMARHLVGQPMKACASLMWRALSHREWGRQAIEKVPAFFLTHSHESDLFDVDAVAASCNAFQALASLDVSPHQASYDSTREIIQALKAIGVKDFTDPISGNLCIHTAASNHANESFRAFVDEFPEQLDVVKKDGLRPLHFAASSRYPENVKLLIEAGAGPRPGRDRCTSALLYAVAHQNHDGAMFLIETGAYDDGQVEEVCQTCGGEVADRLRAYHAAVKAQRAVSGSQTNLGSPLQPVIKPL